MMRSQQNSKKRKWLRVFVGLMLFILLGTGIYGFTVYKSLTHAVDTMHQPIDRKKSKKRPEQVTLTKKEPFSILILGVDERTGDRGRSDTMIVLTVNPNLNSIKMLSIPRDTRTEIIGKGTNDKINHAYAFGGVEMAMNTTENFLDIPIDYYMKINMEGFKDIVDSVGGVTINNDLDFSTKNVHFPKGEISLNGEKALMFARMRYEDPRGDFGRQQRQRQIIQAVINKGTRFSSLTKFDDFFAVLSKNVKTNLTFDELVDIQANYKTVGTNVQQRALTGSGKKIDNIYYFIVPEEEKLKVQDELKTHLELTS